MFNTFDFVFSGGVTFADIISFNFSLTVDPTGLRVEGTPDAEGAVALAMVCTQNEYDAYPDPAETDKTCGETVLLPVKVTTGGARLPFY